MKTTATDPVATENAAIIDAILGREGGATYTDRAADRGGPTKYGITHETLERWRGRSVTPADVRALEETEARAIYADVYIRRPRLDRIKELRLRAALVDWAVNSGPARAVKALQAVVGVRVDGTIGPETLAALDARGAESVLADITRKRVADLLRIALEEPSTKLYLQTHPAVQLHNLRGWIFRAVSMI